MAEQVFSNRYRIRRHVARGGMAEVYLAHDLLLDRPVALKMLFPEFASNRSFVERFRREARAAANLNHPNIVSVYDWGEEGNRYFIVMEFLEGHTLRELIVQNRRLPATKAAEIGAEIAAALGFAHRHGVIHRDVKPGNIMITPTGIVKVTDFGIARAGDPAENLTQTGAVMGTATYFSPEQAQGKPLDNRSDIYSLGCVLYEMVTGGPPFTGENPVAIAYQHVRELPPPLSDGKFRVPGPFEAVVMKAMAKDVAERYATAEELRADLISFCEGRAVGAGPPTMVAPPDEAATIAATKIAAPGTQVLTAAPPPMAPAPAGRRTGTYIAVLLVLLALLGLLLFYLYRSLGAGEATTTVLVPFVQGKPEAEAANILTGLGLRPERLNEPNDEVREGHVIDQDPKSGTRIEKGSPVTLKVSQGPAPGTVPDVVGFSFNQARASLERAGFQVSRKNEYSSAPAEEVIDQTPAPRSKLARNSPVRLTVSRGPQPTTTVPPTTVPVTEPSVPATNPPFTFTTPPTRPRTTTTVVDPDEEF